MFALLFSGEFPSLFKHTILVVPLNSLIVHDNQGFENDPHAGSPTSTLLRLLPLLDWEYCSISASARVAPSPTSRGLYSQSITGNDGRCVQEPGTYSLRSDETRIQDIPRSWRIITMHQSPSRLRLTRFPDPFGPGCFLELTQSRTCRETHTGLDESRSSLSESV